MTKLKLPGLSRPEPANVMALIEIGRQLTRSLDVDRVIDAIIDQTISAISAADAAALFLYDPERDRLIMRAAQGFDREALARVQLRPQESMAGKVFMSRRSAIFDGKERIDEGMNSMSAENRRWYAQAIRHLKHPISVMAAPVQTADRCLGVLVVDNFYQPRKFSTSDLSLLEAVASQASVALETSDLYQREKRNADRLAEVNQQLLRVTAIHEQMTRAILEGQDPQALAEWLSGSLRCPVLLQDHLLSLIACAGTFDGAGLPGQPAEYRLADTGDLGASLERLRSSNCLIDVPISSVFARRMRRQAVSITAGGETLGFLTVLKAGAPLGKVEVMTLEKAATAFAVALMRDRAIVATEQRLTGEVLWSLISSEPDERVQRRAAQMGVDLQQRYAVVVAALEEPSERLEGLDHHSVQAIHKRFQDSAERLLRENAAGSLTTMDSNGLVILLRLTQPEGELKPEVLAANLQRALARDLPEVTCSMAIGRECSVPSDFRASYREALTALRLNRVRATHQAVIRYEALGTARLVLETGDRAQLIDFARGVLGPTMRYDEEHGGDLMRTLRTYLKENRRHSTAAKKLFIHVNTLDYRLRRIEELLGGPLEESDRWLDVHLALKVLELLE